MTPTLGHIVLYSLTEQDAEQVNRRREAFYAYRAARLDDAMVERGSSDRSGHVGHWGNPVRAGEEFPAMVVATFGGSVVNLQVHLDGNDALWATSRPEVSIEGGIEPGCWRWPPRV